MAYFDLQVYNTYNRFIVIQLDSRVLVLDSETLEPVDIKIRNPRKGSLEDLKELYDLNTNVIKTYIKNRIQEYKIQIKRSRS